MLRAESDQGRCDQRPVWFSETGKKARLRCRIELLSRMNAIGGSGQDRLAEEKKDGSQDEE